MGTKVGEVLEVGLIVGCEGAIVGVCEGLLDVGLMVGRMGATVVLCLRSRSNVMAVF